MHSRSPHRLVLLSLTVLAIAACRDEFEPSTHNDIPGVAFAAVATSDTAFASMDTYINEGKPDENFGNLHRLRLRKAGRNRALVLFDQAAIQAAVGTGTLVSATLELTIRSDKNDDWPPSGGTIDIHRMNQSWAELGATWHCAADSDVTNSQPDCPATSWDMAGAPPWEPSVTAQALITNGQTGVVSFEVTQDVAAFLSGTANHGWIVKKADESQSGTVLFHSRDVNQPSNTPPALILTVAASTVPPQAPDTLPAWVYSDTNVVSNSTAIPAPFLKNIVIVEFFPSATQADREAAVALVGGIAVGGYRPSQGEGDYYIQIADTAAGQGLIDAVDQLQQLPQVLLATYEVAVDFHWRKPNDGAQWQSWKLSPDSASSASMMWALEAIAAPLAWGCSVGDSSTVVAVVDGGFKAGLPDLGNLSIMTPGVTSAGEHGVNVSSALGATGNNDSLMTGMMWKGDVRGYDFGYISQGPNSLAWTRLAMQQLQQAGRDGAKIINLSLGKDWNPNVTLTPQRNLLLTVYGNNLELALLSLQLQGHEPLVVVSAGNDRVDAAFSGFPRANAVGRLSANRILVVGGSDDQRNFYVDAQGGSNDGNLVDVVAPGKQVVFLDSVGQLQSDNGTSFSAAYVSGIAGLLLSFDPTLTAVELHNLIIDGAQQGNRTVPIGGTHYLANAYETLRMAARRPGAPLCGNRVWTVGGQVFAERVPGDPPEPLATLADTLSETRVHHGGRRIDLRSFGARHSLLYSNGTWTPAPDPSILPDGLPGGTAYSWLAISHGFDSMAVLEPSGGAGPDMDVGIFDVYSGSTVHLATVPAALPPLSSSAQCIRLLAQFTSDSVPVFTGYRCIDSVFVGTGYSAGFTPSFSPFSDSVYVAVTLSSSSTTSSGPPTAPCPWSQLQNGHETQLCTSSYTSTSNGAVNTDFWAVQKRQNATPSRLPWSIPGSISAGGVVGMALSEDGTQGVFDVYATSSSTTFTPQTITTQGGTTINGFFVSSSQSSESCAYAFLDLASGQPTRQAVDLSGACVFTGGGGTISPLRAGLSRN